MTEFTASQKRKYVAKVLRMNPVQKSAQILKFRRRLLGVESPENTATVDYSKLDRLRQTANDQIDQIRKQMWKLQPNRLRGMLAEVDTRQLPELKTAVDRLNLVINHHKDFQELAAHRLQHINLTNTVKRVVMLPPKEAGALKESYLRQIVESPELSRIQKAIRMQRQEFDGIYQMESDWFDEILRLKARKQPKSDDYQNEESSLPGWLIWIGFVVLFRIIAMALRQN